MASSGYTAITFIANEQPTTAKWNLIGSNDSSFNLGTGLEDSVIINRHLLAGAVTPNKLASAAPTTWAWQSSTPSIDGITIGNGEYNYNWCRIGNMVVLEVIIMGGSTTSASGAIRIPLPVAAKSRYSTTVWRMLGVGLLTDEGAAVYDVRAVSYPSDSTKASLVVSNAAGTYTSIATAVTSGTPFTFGNTDKLSLLIQYEAA